MRTALAIPGLAFLLASTSCRSQVEDAVNPKPGVAITSARTHVPQFTDIPTPNNFTLQNEKLESYIQEAGLWRNGALSYSGRGRASDAIAYFEERLPQHGWTLTNRGSTGNETHLEWKKGDTCAKIELTSSGLDDLLDLKVLVSTPRVASNREDGGMK